MIYATGRTAGVLGRPATVYLANNFLGAPASQGIAITLLASSIGLLLIGADPHRRYYSRLFAVGANGAPMSFFVYLASVGSLGLAGCAAVFGIVYGSTHSIRLGAAAVAYFASEKIADELLRLRLFERAFVGWGGSMLLRTALQLTGITLLLLTQRGSGRADVAIVLLTLGNILVFGPQLPPVILRAVLGAKIRVANWLVGRGVRSLWQHRTVWAVALLSAGTGYVDRVITLGIDKTQLPLVLLVVMCFSAVAMSVDFFYLSRHRRDFLHGSIAIDTAGRSPAFIAALLGGVTVAVIACIGVLRTSKGGDAVPLAYIVGIGILQTSVAVASVAREIAYWAKDVRGIIVIELTFWATLAAAAGTALAMRATPSTIFLIIAAVATGRLVMYVIHARRTVAGAASHNP